MDTASIGTRTITVQPSYGDNTQPLSIGLPQKTSSSSHRGNVHRTAKIAPGARWGKFFFWLWHWLWQMRHGNVRISNRGDNAQTEAPRIS